MDSSKVIEIIAEQMGIDASTITEETTFEELHADSLDLFQIISAIEDEFDVEFDGDETEKIKSVKDAIEYLQKVLG